jgi:hypothetical protein
MTLNEKWSDLETKLNEKVVTALKNSLNFEKMMPV